MQNNFAKNTNLQIYKIEYNFISSNYFKKII